MIKNLEQTSVNNQSKTLPLPATSPTSTHAQPLLTHFNSFQLVLWQPQLHLDQINLHSPKTLATLKVPPACSLLLAPPEVMKCLKHSPHIPSTMISSWRTQQDKIIRVIPHDHHASHPLCTVLIQLHLPMDLKSWELNEAQKIKLCQCKASHPIEFLTNNGHLDLLGPCDKISSLDINFSHQCT